MCVFVFVFVCCCLLLYVAFFSFGILKFCSSDADAHTQQTADHGNGTFTMHAQNTKHEARSTQSAHKAHKDTKHTERTKHTKHQKHRAHRASKVHRASKDLLCSYSRQLNLTLLLPFSLQLVKCGILVFPVQNPSEPGFDLNYMFIFADKHQTFRCTLAGSHACHNRIQKCCKPTPGIAV